MNSPTEDWRTKLAAWLGSNLKQASPDLQELRQAFVQRFPREQLPNLTLDEYALGKPDSFCYWLEFKTGSLGSVAGGSSSKWGIWWSKDDRQWKWNKAFQCSNPEEAFTSIRSGLVSLVEAAASSKFDQIEQIGSNQIGVNKNGLRAKPLYLYFPDKFLPISSPYHLTHFLIFFSQQPTEGLHTKNRQLLNFLKSQPEFVGMDTLQMMAFLYSAIPPGANPLLVKDSELVQPKEIVQLATLTEETRNLILYGPPGTGKTYTVQKFASFFLGEQLSIPLAPEQQRQEILQPLKWHDTIALAMYLKRPQKCFKVPELVDDSLI